MGGKTRKFLTELPKVGTLLLFGGAVLFPMYMMIVISFMTPAQLERFPWFPVSMNVPRQIDCPRGGMVSLEPAALELRREGRPPQTVTIAPDARFQLHMPGAGSSDDSWTVTPSAQDVAGNPVPAVVAELQAANVWDVASADGGTFTIDGKLFDPPAGFTSTLSGLQYRSRALRELRLAEAAYRKSRLALKATDRVGRADDEATRSEFELQATVAMMETADLEDVATKALARARTFAAEAAKWHILADDEVDAAREKLRRVGLNLERVRGRVEPYLGRHEAKARGKARFRSDGAAGEIAAFKVNRGETIAVLLADAATEVAKVPGRITVDTQWEFKLNTERLFLVRPRPGIERTAGRETVPGRPLADLVANRDIDLVWKPGETGQGGQWQHDGQPFARLLPPGFHVQAPPAPDQGGSATVILAKGTVIGTVTEPAVHAVRSGDSLIVGLAVRQPDGTFQIPFGEGRWVYPLRVTRDTPFGIRATLPEDGAMPPPGEKIAEQFVNRQRTVAGTRAAGWMAARDEVFLAAPPGFVSTFAAPASDLREERILPSGTVLAALRMPKATVTIDDDFIIVGMTGATWGSGQWAYTLGHLDSLQIVKGTGPPMAGSGPWSLDPRTDDQQRQVDEALAPAREAVGRAGAATAKAAGGDGIVRKEAELAVLAASQALARAVQDVVPPDTIAEFRTERRVKLEYFDNKWMLEGRPVRWPPGFVKLRDEGGILSGRVSEAVLERGTVLARLYAERPCAQELQASGPARLLTAVAADGDGMTVSFAHAIPFPVRANVLVKDQQKVGEGQKLCGFFQSEWLDTENYSEAIRYVAPFIFNTVIVAVLTMIFSLFFASLSAFVFSRFQFPGKAVFYGMIIVLLMIPGVLNLVPLYAIVNTMGLLEQPLNLLGRINAILVLVLPAIAGGQVMNVYIMRNNLETLAKDLFDAARIDGASNFQTYRHIAIPLSRPIMGTLSIFALLSQWNNLIWPWVVIRHMEHMTITAGLAKLEGQNLSDYGLQMAGAVIASIPLIILFFFMMNLFIRGMQSGAIKA